MPLALPFGQENWGVEMEMDSSPGQWAWVHLPEAPGLWCICASSPNLSMITYIIIYRIFIAERQNTHSGPFLLPEPQVSNQTSWLWHCKGKKEVVQWRFPVKVELAKPQHPQNIAREKLGGWVWDCFQLKKYPPEKKIAQTSILCFQT